MPYTQDDLRTIIAAMESKLASGRAEVRFEGRLLRYATAAEIMTGIRYFQGLLAQQVATDSGATRTRIVRLSGSKGF